MRERERVATKTTKKEARNIHLILVVVEKTKTCAKTKKRSFCRVIAIMCISIYNIYIYIYRKKNS